MDENKLASVINVDETSIKNKAGSSETQLFKDTWINPGVKRMYHDQRLGQSKWAFWLSFFGSIAGFIVIVASLLIGLYTKNTGWIGVVGGAVTECVSVLFYALSNQANKKISEFYQELTKENNINHSIDLVQKVNDKNIKDDILSKLSLHLAGISDDKICELTTNNLTNRDFD